MGVNRPKRSTNIKEYDDLRRRFRNVDVVSTRWARAALENIVNDIVELAQKMAPEDTGTLVKAIKVKKGTDVSRNRRKEMYVEIDFSMLRDSGRNKKGFDYFTLRHNEESGRGKKSEQKQDATGVEVGPFFIDRAIDFYEEKLEETIQNTVTNQLRKKGLL